MARTTEQIDSEVRKILLERIIHEAMRGREFGLEPVDLLARGRGAGGAGRDAGGE